MNYRAALPLVLIGLAGRTCLILVTAPLVSGHQNMVFGHLYVPFLHNYLIPLEGPFPGCIAAGSGILFVPSHCQFGLWCGKTRGRERIKICL